MATTPKTASKPSAAKKSAAPVVRRGELAHPARWGDTVVQGQKNVKRSVAHAAFEAAQGRHLAHAQGGLANHGTPQPARVLNT